MEQRWPSMGRWAPDRTNRRRPFLEISKPNQEKHHMTNTTMNEQETLEAIREEMVRIKVPDAEQATMDTDWRDLDVDSLDLVELVTALEDRFSIKIADGQLKEISGVGDAVRLVGNLTAQGAPA
jgi:acyl carrier protein